MCLQYFVAVIIIPTYLYEAEQAMGPAGTAEESALEYTALRGYGLNNARTKER